MESLTAMVLYLTCFTLLSVRKHFLGNVWKDGQEPQQKQVGEERRNYLDIVRGRAGWT
ncbi:protein of unknown function [Nitrospira japonica]|uniref:Uncharacterized protein n=1 Tax=Nitrospira japonica TaxID=1325564 RepID=A0A1W1I0G1_9BACT|nr:protein of unknown function [Nitrospira japonica]